MIAQKVIIPALRLVQATDEADAWQAYQALALCTKARPNLADNPCWQQLTREAYARWERLFEVA